MKTVIPSSSISLNENQFHTLAVNILRIHLPYRNNNSKYLLDVKKHNKKLELLECEIRNIKTKGVGLEFKDQTVTWALEIYQNWIKTFLER